VVQQSGDAIVSMSMDGTIRSWNHGAERLYQYTAAEMIGHLYNPPLPDAVKKEHRALLKRIRKGETVESVETLVYRKDGTLVDVSLTVSPVRGADNQINAFAAVGRDITQKKIAEKRISEFYSVISHELRTPLTSIRGALTLISAGIVEPGSTEANELIDIAQNSTSRLIRLINDILDLRKIEAGKFELNLIEISSKDLVESAVSSMQGFAEEKKVFLTTSVPIDYQVEGDRDRLTQVLTNLISNALKYAPEGTAVDVAAVRANHSMRFMITDTGPGIPLAYQAKLFGKFEQVDASDSRAKEGSGLGLAISKAIIEQHGGTISFESLPGIKTVFQFEVPLSNNQSSGDSLNEIGRSEQQPFEEVQALSPLRLVSPSSIRPNSLSQDDLIAPFTRNQTCSSSITDSGHFFPAFTKDELKSPPLKWPVHASIETSTIVLPEMIDFRFGKSDRPRKILIVEDDAELASLLRINLERQNYVCLTAQTLEHARALIQTEAPDALVLDLELPDGDGLSLLGLLPGAAQTGWRTPVIVITGSERAVKKGESSIVDWLQKPFHQGNLSAAVDRAFKNEDRRKKVMVIDDDLETKMAVTAELSRLEINFVESSDCADICKFDEGPQLDLIIFRESCLQGEQAMRAFRKLRGKWSDYVPIVVYSSSELNGYGQKTSSVSISHHVPAPGLEANFLANVENALFSFLSHTAVTGASSSVP
jgi:PAS domain S-box-containing protein